MVVLQEPPILEADETLFLDSPGINCNMRSRLLSKVFGSVDILAYVVAELILCRVSNS